MGIVGRLGQTRLVRRLRVKSKVILSALEKDRTFQAGLVSIGVGATVALGVHGVLGLAFGFALIVGGVLVVVIPPLHSRRSRKRTGERVAILRVTESAKVTAWDDGRQDVEVIGKPAMVEVVAHSGVVSTSPKPTVDRRQLLQEQLEDLKSSGERILRIPDMERVLRESGPWQDEVFDLLDSALVDLIQAQQFAQIGAPIPKMPRYVGLNGRIVNQVVMISDILRDIDSFEIKEAWQPTITGQN